jgi:hypothetical protein
LARAAGQGRHKLLSAGRKRGQLNGTHGFVGRDGAGHSATEPAAMASVWTQA